MRLPVSLPSLLDQQGPAKAPLPPIARWALLSAIESGSYAVGLFDPGDRLVYANEAFRLAWAVEDHAGSTFDSVLRSCHTRQLGAVVATDDINVWLSEARRRRRDGPADRSFEIDLHDGRWMWVTERRLDDGWLAFIAQDITRLKQSERTLRAARDAALQAALTDPLTGLPNRRWAMQTLDECIAAGQPFHVAIADVDSFKQINDRYGHAAGDEVLVLFSSELRTLHGGQSVARLGGDEFIVISSAEQDEVQFRHALELLLQERRRSSEAAAPNLVFAVSVGGASFPAHGKQVRDLLSAADNAMYQSKAIGQCTLIFS